MLISRMIDGQFPAYERVIPKGNDKHIEFERDRLTNAVKRVALLSNERSRAVKFQIDKGKVEVTSSSPELGEAQRDAAGRLQRRRRCRSASTRSTCSISLGVVDDRRRGARVEGRSEPGRDEAGRRRGLRLHLRDHADAGLTAIRTDTRSNRDPGQHDRRAGREPHVADAPTAREPGDAQRARRRGRRLRRRQDQGPRGPRGRPQAAGDVHRLDRAAGPAPPRLRGRRQLDRRGAGRLLRPGQRHHPHRRLGHRRRQRPRHPGRSARRAASRRPRSC